MSLVEQPEKIVTLILSILDILCPFKPFSIESPTMSIRRFCSPICDTCACRFLSRGLFCRGRRGRRGCWCWCCCSGSCCSACC